MMEPVVNKLEEEYKGRFALVCLDKDKNKELAGRFKARVTPTLVFCDKDGKEVYRHEGVMDKKSILAKLKEAGMT
jgi:thioredoxin 1